MIGVFFVFTFLLLLFSFRIFGAVQEKGDERSSGTDAEIKSPSNVHTQNGLTLINESYPRGMDHIGCVAGRKSAVALRVRLMENGRPLAGQVVRFRLINSPKNINPSARWIEPTQTHTDAAGFATARFTAGEGSGLYIVEAQLTEHDEIEPVRIRITARAKLWIVTLMLGLFGGLALFLLGMEETGYNLQRMAGDRFRSILGGLTKNAWMGALLGIVVTFLLQSSSATTVMLVGLVGATLMSLTQAIGVMIGAKIGTTLTIQVIAFNISQYAIGIVAVGYAIKLLARKRKIFRRIAKTIIGFGFIFFGMGLMNAAMTPLRSEPEFTRVMLGLGTAPLLAILFSALFTAVIQSSSATIGLAMAFAASGLLTLEACIPISMGAAVGTCATAMLASLGAARSGKQVAVAHLIYSFMMIALIYPFLAPVIEATRNISLWLGHTSIERQIANGFTIFSVVPAIVVLPFVPLIRRITLKLVPEKKTVPPFAPTYIQESSIDFPSVAVNQALLETMRMAGLVRRQLIGVALLIENPSERRCYELAEMDDKIDLLERKIRPFLARVGANGLDQELAARERAIVYVADSLENMGDIIVRSLLHALEKMARKQIRFSVDGRHELLAYHGQVVSRFDRLTQAIKTLDYETIDQIIESEENEEWEARSIRAAHLERLHRGVAESLESSEAHLSVVGGLHTIARRITDVARIVREELR